MNCGVGSPTVCTEDNESVSRTHAAWCGNGPVVGERRGSGRIRRVGFVDLDNDGIRDLFTANSHVNDLVVGAIGVTALKVISLENPSILKSADFGGEQKCLPT